MTEKLCNVLIVDDDPIVLNGVGQELEYEGYNVTLASSGEEALKLLGDKRQDFAIVISDQVMGDVNGLQVLQKAKEVSIDCMVMILTGYGELEVAIKAIRLGVDDFMEKPGTPEERIFRVKRLHDKYLSDRRLKIYESFLNVCCVCKKIRDDSIPGQEKWCSVEHYLNTHGALQVTSGCCPECYEKEMKALATLVT